VTPKRLRASAVCVAEGHLLVVRLRDPVTGVVALYPPGGAVEAGETPAETARRETWEETGVAVHVDERRTLVETYPFRWDGIDREVTTHYFAARLEGAFDKNLPKVVDAPYNLGAEWVPVADALDAMRVNPAILDATARCLRL
jgi:8-oxo-dGTP pyrophosphatase MutT (NUDIX family)